MNYNIIVHITGDENNVIIPVNYEKIYDLRKDVTSMGVNGIMQELDNKFLYFPPNRIKKIEIEKI